jgi:hypothetical protein
MMSFQTSKAMRADNRGEGMSKEKQDETERPILATNGTTAIDETTLFERVSTIIENRKSRAYAHANQETTLMFWEIGGYINSVVLNNKRAEYGKRILTALSSKLVERYGESFSERNLYRMTAFAEIFSDVEILTALSSKLSWSHFMELLRLKTPEARLFSMHRMRLIETSASESFAARLRAKLMRGVRLPT